MTAPAPADARLKAYAGVELLLDVCHSARSLADIDLESLLIYFCVLEATMQPLMTNADAHPGLLTAETVPESYRGSITMLLVSEKLGIPRETVRRKVKALVGNGMLTEDPSGRIQAPLSLSDPSLRGCGEATSSAAGRYLARLRKCGVRLETDNGPG